MTNKEKGEQKCDNGKDLEEQAGQGDANSCFSNEQQVEGKEDNCMFQHTDQAIKLYGMRGPPMENPRSDFRLCCCFSFALSEQKKILVARQIDEREDRTWHDILHETTNPQCWVFLLGQLVIVALFTVGARYTYPRTMTYPEISVQALFTSYCADFLAYVCTALMEHQFKCLHRFHQWEHDTFFEGTLLGNLKVGFDLRFRVLAILIILFFVMSAPALSAGKLDEFESIIFVTAVIREFVEFATRMLGWLAEQRPTVYYYSPTWYLNYLKFFKMHFTQSPFEYYEDDGLGRKGMSKAVVAGGHCPFWDVCMGTCPFEIKYSLPFIWLDYFFNSPETFETPLDPRTIKWNWKQKLWYSFWIIWVLAVAFFSLAIYYAPWGSQYIK
uniref:Uncharacterized protein n=2 Tax=Ditylum brightwellii TaxID=49249 RepID=A0A6V2EXY0_9STRA